MTEPSPAARSRRVVAVICIGLFVGTVLLFARSVGHTFVNYDDPRYVTANPFVQDPFSRHSIAWAFGGHLELWQPLTWLSHMLDWALYGNRAAGHHFTSVLWHATNAVLAFLVMRRLTGAIWLSAFAAALFAWHPLRVESVSWIAERKDVMSGCFFLLTLWCYLGYAAALRSNEGRETTARQPAGLPETTVRASGEPQSSRLRYAATFGCFCAGLLCKPTLVTTPLLLLALDVWPLRRRGQTPWLRLAFEKLPFFVAAAAVGLITVTLQRTGGQFTLEVPFLARVENVPIALIRYVAKLLWPATFSVAYPHPGWWPLPFALGASATALVLALAAWRMRRTQPWILVGGTWFVALLLPTIGLVQVGFQSIADRYTYLPALGAELAIVWTLHRWVAGRPALLRASLGCALLGPLAVRTWQQQAVWRDSVTLFRHAVAVSPASAITEGFLGYTLVSVNRIDEAVPHLDRALQLDPNNEMAVWATAHVAASQGRIDDAIRLFRRDLALRPGNAATEYELGLQLLRRGDMLEAADHLRAAANSNADLLRENRERAEQAAHNGEIATAAIRFLAAALLEPQSAEAQVAAGRALLAIDRDEAARAAFEKALALNPAQSDAEAQLGLLLLNRGDISAAEPHLRHARELAPTLVAARVGLGRLEETRGNRSAADENFRVALAQEPANADVNRAWADILARRRNFSAALPFYRRAAELRPADASMHAALGYALFFTGDKKAAAAEWRRTLDLDPKFPGLRERLEQLGP